MGNRFSALRNRNFALLWTGSVISNVGAWMQIVAQGWLVYTLTSDPTHLGLVGLGRGVPMLLLPLAGGVVADRVSRLKLLRVTQLANFVFSLVLAVLVSLDLAGVGTIVLFSF